MDNFKETWAVLNSKLDGTKLLNDRIIHEMLQTKSNRSLGRLMCYELMGFFILLLIVPMCIFKWVDSPSLHGLLISCFVVIGICIVWQVIKLLLLLGINLSGKITGNIRKVNRYALYIKWEKQGSFLLLIPWACFICFYVLIAYNLSPVMWGVTISLILFILVYTIWSYKQLYNKNIDSIRQSLEELKELKEE